MWNDPPTRFVSLRRMPATPAEVVEVAKAIEAGDTSEWFTVYEQPNEWMREGDWRPCQFLDQTLTETAMELEDELWRLLGAEHLGPSGRAIRGTFRKIDDDEVDDWDGYRVFWGRANDLRPTMEAEPEQAVVVRPRCDRSAYSCRQGAGHVLLATKFNTTSGRVLAIFSEEPSLGSAWVPVAASYADRRHKDKAKAMCAWFNSTPGALGFFMRRSTTLTNPSFSQDALRNLPVPDFSDVDTDELVEAFAQTRKTIIQPWKHAADDPVRDTLDRAAATTIGMDIEKIRDIRRRLSREPTISNRPQGD